MIIIFNVNAAKTFQSNKTNRLHGLWLKKAWKCKVLKILKR